MIKRRTYLCICEGQQETMYLAHIARLLTHFPERVVKFNTTIGSPSELKKHYEEYDSAALFDQDGCQNAFEEGIRVCQALDRSGQRSRSKKHVYHAYSNVNFDLWLILHKEDFTRPRIIYGNTEHREPFTYRMGFGRIAAGRFVI